MKSNADKRQGERENDRETDSLSVSRSIDQTDRENVCVQEKKGMGEKDKLGEGERKT